MTVNTTIDAPVLVRDFCIDALRKSGVTAIDDTPSDEEVQIAFRSMGAMLRSWEVEMHLWATEQMPLTLVSGQSAYTLSPRVLGLMKAYLVNPDGSRIPIRVVTREQFERLPTPQSAGVPYWCWLDRQRASAVLTVFPIINLTGYALDMTVKRVLFDLGSLNDEADIPPEWQECVIYNLAARLCDDNGRVGEVANRIAQRAQILLLSLQAQDREASTFVRSYRTYRRRY